MIKIITKYDDNSSLDFLATQCKYEITLSVMEDGSITSALCDGENPGEQARDIIDNYKLLRDNELPFPTTLAWIYHTLGYVFPNSIGV